MEEVCHKCNKVRLILIECKCKHKYCIKHQLPHKHKCSYNYSLENINKIINNNPQIIIDKIVKI